MNLVGDLLGVFKGNSGHHTRALFRQSCIDVLDHCVINSISNTVGKIRQLMDYNSTCWKSFFDYLEVKTEELKKLLIRHYHLSIKSAFLA